jgi:hypothetical protein
MRLRATLCPPTRTSPTCCRKWFYRVVAAGQTLIVGLGLDADVQVSPIVAILLAVVGVPVAVVRIQRDVDENRAAINH